jgi:hypothetical protein
MFAGKSHLGNYSDSMLVLDYNVGRIIDVIRVEAPDTIVIFHRRQRRLAVNPGPATIANALAVPRAPGVGAL